MKALRFLLCCLLPALLAGLLLPGCFVESLHPLSDTAVPASAADSSLLGTWETKVGANDHPGTLVIAQGNEDHYDLKYTEEGKSAELRAALMKVGTQTYLDIWIASLDQFDQVPLAAVAHLVPAHSFWKVSREGDRLSLARLDYERLDKSLEQHKVLVQHTRLEDGFVVLTASPAQLRAFLAKWAADPAAFAKPLAFERKK